MMNPSGSLARQRVLRLVKKEEDRDSSVRLKTVEPEQRLILSRDAALSTPKEVVRLVSVYKENKDPKCSCNDKPTIIHTNKCNKSLIARDEIIRTNMGFVYMIARKVGMATGYDVDDLVQEGVFGLIKACDEFDESYGVKFLTYAANWVRAYIGRSIERMEAVMHGTLHIITNFRRPFREYERLVLSGVPKKVALERVAKKIKSRKVTPRSLVRYFEVLLLMKPKSLDVPIDDSGHTMGDVIASSSPRVEDKIDEKKRSIAVQKAVAHLRPKLSPLAKATLDMRILPLDGNYKTLQEVGDFCNVSRERVRQIEVELLNKLKKVLLSQGLLKP